MVGYFKLNAYGSIQSANKQHEGFESMDLLAKDTDGKVFKYYSLTIDAGSGLYEPDTVKNTKATTAERSNAIKAKADEIIETAYSPLKQRKLISITVSLKDKRDDLGIPLTIVEEEQLQKNRDINAWITAIRTIENIAIANGTALDEVVWDV